MSSTMLSREKRRLITYYHGTSASNAASILRHGFRKGTFFARNLQDALEFGGPHVFQVIFPYKRYPTPASRILAKRGLDWWELTTDDAVSPERIATYAVYSKASKRRWPERLDTVAKTWAEE